MFFKRKYSYNPYTSRLTGKLQTHLAPFLKAVDQARE
jgi:hypothetical protein